MGFFIKTDEEKKLEEERRLKIEEDKIKKEEKIILNSKAFWGKVGHIHQGLSYGGVWGVRDNGKMKFKPSKFLIYDDKMLIQRNKMVVEYTNIKEIFQEMNTEAIIILNNGDGIPIQGSKFELKAFVNILKRLMNETKQDIDEVPKNNINTSSEDKIDKIIKLGEMHDKGLLSDEEFAALKNELLKENKQEPPAQSEDNIEHSKNICENCGTELSKDCAFCSECGTKINK